MKNILVAFIGIFLTFFVLEVIVRVLPKDLTKIDYDLIKEERIFTSSRQMNFIPNLNRVWTGLGRPTIWNFNEMGYRERGIQLDKPSNIYRITFLGDSVVMGFGVEEYESLPRRLENALRPLSLKPGMVHFQVLDLGIQGFSSPQYLSVLKEDVTRMKPDLVIIGFYSNDPMEAVSFEYNKKYSFLKSLPDVIFPYKINRFLRANSRLFLLVLNRYYNLVEGTSVSIKPTPELKKMGWELARKDFLEMKKITDKMGIELLVLGIPHPSLEVAAKTPDLERSTETAKIMKEGNIKYYDMLKDLKAYGPVRDLYLDDLNDHFSIKGNEYAAQLVTKYLFLNHLTL